MKVLIEVESSDKKSIASAITLLNQLSGGKAEPTQAPSKGKGKGKKVEEEEEDEFEEVESNFQDFGDGDGEEEDESFGEDDPMSFEEDEFPEEEEEIEEKPKKGKAKGKAAPAKGGKKISLTDLQKAFRAFAAENGNAEALKILKKFKAKNVQGLDEEVYPQVMKLLK